MSKLLFDLRNVPDDEADDVRELLNAAEIAFYETRPSAWGIFAGGLWVVDETAHGAAKELLADYQQQRQQRARADYEQARREGRAETLFSTIRREPGRVVVLVLATAFVLALTLLPFLLLANP